MKAKIQKDTKNHEKLNNKKAYMKQKRKTNQNIQKNGRNRKHKLS